MAASETRNAEINPTARTPHSVPLTGVPDRTNLRALMPLAPIMVGIAMKKENSAAAARDSPSSMAPRIVEPEREVPGISASTWKQPMSRAVADLPDLAHAGSILRAQLLQKQECNTVHDQCGGDNSRGVQVRVHPVIQQDANKTGRYDGKDDLQPKYPGLLFLPG